MKKKKGFTLIELLAVIVILAVIALISVPIVLNIIERVKKSAFEETAYGILESARLYYVENVVDNKEIEDKVFSYETEENELTFKGTKPKGGIIVLKKDGQIEMAIHNGKWCAIKEGEQIKVIDYNENTCKIDSPMIEEGNSIADIELGSSNAIPGSYFKIRNQKGIVKCTNLSDENKEITNTAELKEGENCVKCSMMYEDKEITSLTRTFIVKSSGMTVEEIMKEEAVGENGIVVTDTDGNRRFAGSNPNNWVCFGDSSIIDPANCDSNHKWRIIGEFDSKLKIMTNYYYSTSKAWDTSNRLVWANATLNTELNGSSFYSKNTYIDEVHRAYIVNATWYTGEESPSGTYTLQAFIDGEKSSDATGHVGLMSVADYGYAGSSCTTSTVMTITGNACMSNNWIGYSNFKWLITPDSRSNQVRLVSPDGKIVRYYSNASDKRTVQPVVYLDSSVKIITGLGTSSSPYILTK